MCIHEFGGLIKTNTLVCLNIAVHVFLIKVFEYYCIHDKRQYLLIAEFLFLVLSF